MGIIILGVQLQPADRMQELPRRPPGFPKTQSWSCTVSQAQGLPIIWEEKVQEGTAGTANEQHREAADKAFSVDNGPLPPKSKRKISCLTVFPVMARSGYRKVKVLRNNRLRKVQTSHNGHCPISK